MLRDPLSRRALGRRRRRQAQYRFTRWLRTGSWLPLHSCSGWRGERGAPSDGHLDVESTRNQRHICIMCATHRSKTESRGATGTDNVIVRFTGLDTTALASGHRSGAHSLKFVTWLCTCARWLCKVRVRYHFCQKSPMAKYFHPFSLY